MPKTNRIQMLVSELKTLKVGDKFVAYWAKDDDPRDVRINYKTLTVKTILPDGTIDDGVYTWNPHDKHENCGDDVNYLDTSRGYAYFYKV